MMVLVQVPFNMNLLVVMINSFIKMPSLNQLKARDRWENDIKTAYYQAKLMKDNFHIYQNNTTQLVQRYEKWLKSREMEPSINLNLYKSPH